ncbi:hypothetical protein NDA01_23230 [Trichocoleus desertorum AS-A10]|uniref:hypothetical protein n=1 Tax=Trichocoleus desertorum TaxID=1481672 RepID=UPI003299390E
MDWKTLLRSQQADFIKRFKSGTENLLFCEVENQFSELAFVSSQKLKQLRDASWLLAERYKNTAPVHDVFIKHLTGKLGESVIKRQLSNLVAKGSYRDITGNDTSESFDARQWKLFITYIRSYQYLSRYLTGDLFPIGYLRLAANPAISIQVKACHTKANKIQWVVSKAEVEKNSVVVCIWIREEVNEAQPEYHLFLAGFLPTGMIQLQDGQAVLGLEDLLYGGGLRSFIEFIQAQSLQFNSSKAQLDYTSESANSSLSIQIGSWQCPLSWEQLTSLEAAIQELKAQQQEPQIPVLPPHSSAELPLDLNQLWQKVLGQLRPPSTQSLLRQQSRLLSFDGHQARIGISSSALFRVNQRWLPKIEEAFNKTCQHQVKVTLEVIAE